MRNSLCRLVLTILLLVPALSTAASPYPDPLRFAADIEAFTAADLIASPAAGGVLCIGSSSLRFWHGTMVDDLQPLTLIPRGFGGSTMLDVLFYSDRIVVPYRPRAILVYEGDNDLEAGVSPARFLATVQQFLEVVRATLPDTRVYLMSVKPSPSRRRFWPQMQQANAMLDELCAADPGLTYLDVATPMLGDDGQPRAELFLADNLHLNALGYAVWTKVVRDGMVTIEAARE
jgi:lysophospholipase L1-like esterase